MRRDLPTLRNEENAWKQPKPKIIIRNKMDIVKVIRDWYILFPLNKKLIRLAGYSTWHDDYIQTSNIIKADGNIIHTLNSKYKIEYDTINEDVLKLFRAYDLVVDKDNIFDSMIQNYKTIMENLK